MIDIHCHILPMVDDGAPSVRMALDMLDDARSDGTREIVLTPHYAEPYDFYNPKEPTLELFHDLCRIVDHEGIPIRMYLGCEYLMESTRKFLEQREHLLTMNGTHYFLMEFFFDVPAEFALKGVQTVLDQGLIPIIAHPERYDFIQEHLELVEYLHKMGALLQMNKGSSWGQYGSHAEAVSLEILDQRGYDFVGSDAHRRYGRDPLMYGAYEFVCDCCGRQYADLIFEHNPHDMLHDRDIRERT